MNDGVSEVRVIVGTASDDLLMIRHPTRHTTFLSVANRDEARQAVGQSSDPRVIVVYGGVATGQQQLLKDLASSIDVTLPPDNVKRISTILLTPSLGGARSVLTAEFAWVGGMAVVYESEGGPLERDWNRQDVDARTYLRGLVHLAARDNESGSLDELVELVVKIIDTDNCAILRSQVAHAERVLDSAYAGTSGETVDQLWHIRARLRKVEEVLTGHSSDATRLGETLVRTTRDLDAISMLYTAQAMSRLMIQGDRAARDRAHESQLERAGHARLERQIQVINRRLTLVGIALLLPALWLAYWATPSAPVELMGYEMRSLTGQLFIIGTSTLLALGGAGLGLLLSRKAPTERI